MKFGDVVRNKESGDMGTVHYSTFGLSIHMWNEEVQGLSKTLGESRDVLLNHWEVIDLPEGYEICRYGGVRKIV